MKFDPHRRRSPWLVDAPQTDHPPLTGDWNADVAVIGGGIAGLTTALLVQRNGRNVILLESDRVGCGVTGGSNAKVTSLHGMIYSKVEEAFDRDSARVYAEANQAGLEQVAQFAAEIKSFGVDCHFERQPAFTFTCEDDRIDEIRGEADAAQRAGLPATFTTDTDLPLNIRGAVRVENQAQIDPYQYCLGLSRAFIEAGGKICENTRAIDVENDDQACRVVADGGEVQARHVIVTTLLPFLDRGGFFATTSPSRSYAISVTLDGKVPEGMYLGVDSPVRSVRPLPDRTGIIVVGEHHKTGQDADTRDRDQALEAWAREWFPVRSVDHRWSAQDYMTADSLPYIGRMPRGGDRIWTATGFNKWGITTGTFAALILRDLIVDQGNPWASLFDATRTTVLQSAKRFVTENANVTKRFVGDRLKSLVAPNVEELPLGEGGIVTHDGDKVAAFRDMAGLVHACSTECTHFGCFVQWNSAETTWDCPCHGSRFNYLGEILQGPAVKPLDYRVIPTSDEA